MHNDYPVFLPSSSWAPGLRRAEILLAVAMFATSLAFLPAASATAPVGSHAVTETAPSGSVPFYPNIRITDGSSPYAWQVEPTMVVNRSGTVFVGWKEASSSEGAGRRVGFSFSEDSGDTWAPNGLMPQNHSNQGCANSDPWMALAPDDRVYYAYLEYECGSGIDFPSMRNGTDWGPVYYLPGSGGLSDKESIAVGPSGRLYAAWDEADLGNELQITWSDDGGATWAPFVHPTSNSVLGVIVATSRNGTVYLTWWNLGADDIMFDWSWDGGLTWHPDVRVNSVAGSVQSSGSWQIPIPAMVVDPTSGDIYVAWPDSRNRNQDIYIARSQDGGRTWSANARINDDSSGRTQYMVDLAVDSRGIVHAAWEDKRNGQWNIFYANSTNGGQAWSSNFRVTTEDTPGTYNRPGDYFAIEAGPDDVIHLVWTDGRGDDFDIYYGRSPGEPAALVTVATDPAGLPVQVDGIGMTSPATFTWPLGSTHQVGVSSPLPISSDARYVWLSWTDGGEIVHDIVANGDMTLRASFETQFRARIAPDPAGVEVLVDNTSITIAASFWWTEGSIHWIEAPSPQNLGPDVRHVWVAWSDGGGRAHAVSASQPVNVTATFAPEYALRIGTDPDGLEFAFDGTVYRGSATLWLSSGTYHTVGTPTFQAGDAGTRFRFLSWSDSGSADHVFLFGGAMILEASFGTEYYLTVTAPVPGSSGSGWFAAGTYGQAVAPSETYIVAPGERSTFHGWGGDATGAGLVSDPILMDGPKIAFALYGTQYYLEVSSAYGVSAGEGWYDEGSVVRAEIGSMEVTLGTGDRAVFRGWSGDATGSEATSDVMTMDGPKVASALWIRQFFLTVLTEYGQPFGAGWYDSGILTAAGVDPGLVSISDGVRAVFTSWTGDATGTDPGRSTSIRMDRPRTAVARWSVEYELRIESAFGNSIGAGWYSSGTSAVAALDTGFVPVSDGVRQGFGGWSADASGGSSSGSDPILMDASKVARATWRIEYLVEVLSDIGGVEGAGWYPAGAQATLTASSEVVTGGQRYAFVGWTGAVTSTERTVSFAVDGPVRVRASWTNLGAARGLGDSTILTAAVLLSITALVGAIVLWRRRGNR